MSTTTDTTTPEPTRLITQNDLEQFLYREARYLDDREFEKWLECYADDVVYWMPSWDDDDTLVENPQRDISLIYYANKGGLEDRVFRIRTDRSGPDIPWTVGGPTCDSVDIVMRDEPLPSDLQEGDFVYIKNAGAYTTAYASQFNGFPLPEVRVFESK